ncbi:unnamed protein product [Caenorhabditis nigoni]
MSISTPSFKETKLVDYCDRRDGIVTTDKQGNVPNEKWKLTYSNGEVLSSNFGFFPYEKLKKGSIKFFVLDDSDKKWICETMKMSGEEGEFLKSLTDFVKHRESKRIYIREVCITPEKPSERRRVFTEEVLEIIPIILKQQGSLTEESGGLLRKYQHEWKKENFHNSVNMETFNSVLEEFDINKGLITIVPDPIYEMSEEDMLEFGSETVMRLSPEGVWLLDSSHAMFSIFQSVVWGVNWKSGDKCRAHENCKRETKRMIIEVMRQYKNIPDGGLIPIARIDTSIDWLRNQCYWTLGSKGICLDVTTSIAIDTRPHSDSLYYHVYQRAVSFYGLPNYDSVFFTEDTSSDSHTDLISVWMTRVMLLSGWAHQFFDKESVDLASVILGLIFKKAPVDSKDGIVFLLKSVQSVIAGLKCTNLSDIERLLRCTAKREGPDSESHQKMLRKALERAEKLRKRKELSKPGKVKNPSSTHVVRPITETVEAEFFEASFLEKLEYMEPKLKITKRDVKNRYSFEPIAPYVKCLPNYKEKEFGNVLNVFSMKDNSEDDESLEALDKEKEDAFMKEDEDTIDELEKQEEFVEFEERKELESEDVKALKKEVERLKTLEEKAQRVDELEEQIREIGRTQVELIEEKAKRVEELERELKGMVLEGDVLNERLVNAKKLIDGKDLEIKVVDEKIATLESLLDGKTELTAIMEQQIINYKDIVNDITDKAKDREKENRKLSLKLMTVEQKRDLDIKKMEEEKKVLEDLLDERTRRADDVEKKMKLRESEMNEMRSELSRMKKQSQDQEKWRRKKNTAIEQLKSEMENSKSRMSEKETEIVILNETNESLVFQLSRLEEETRMSKIEEQERSAMTLKANEQLQTTVKHLSMQNEDQQKTIQNLYGRLAMVPSPPVSTQEEKPESVQSPILTIKNLVDKLANSEDSEEARQFRSTLQRLRNIKDRFQNKDQLKLARTMTDKLITMSNRSEIRELALYEYQQYEANFQNYTHLVDLNIEKMKETRDCSLYSPLPKPPAFSDRFMNEYWLECDKKKKELEMDISDSECLICFFEMNSDQKTLKCDHCNKITHLKCASKWLQIHRSCPHCRREQLDPDEFPALS